VEIAAIIARLRLMLTMMVDDGLESERDGRERERHFLTSDGDFFARRQ
jgi:hypothetical protein